MIVMSVVQKYSGSDHDGQTHVDLTRLSLPCCKTDKAEARAFCGGPIKSS